MAKVGDIAEKRVLSGSTDGKPIKVVATSTTGTTIHQAVNSATNMDEVWLYAFNSDSVQRKLTLEWGGTTAPDQNIVQTIPAQSGLYCVAPGLPLRNNLTITAFAETANVVIITGFANRLSDS